jgi:5-methylcytosine-specific restriction enzyme subunit McrC
MPSAIPIRNVYYLLCYAWNRLTEKGLVDVTTSGTTELVDLLARILITGVSGLRRRGLERSYDEIEREIAGVRGRICIAETVGRLQDRHGRATCVFDELTVDTPQNRVVKAAMRTVGAVDELSERNRASLRRLIRELSEVADRPLTRAAFRDVKLHSNNRHYRFLIDVALLIRECAIPDETPGKVRFRDFSREGPELARLFESFVRNFLRIERRDLMVASEDLDWIASSEDDPQLSLLPTMRTDITVRSGDRTLVIDTKFYEETLQMRYEKQSVHSGHLYQLVSYVRNMENRPGPDGHAEGMLLYPTTSKALDIGYVIQGHKLRVRTVDLSREWRDIEMELLEIV